MNMLRRFLERRPAAELELDVRLAARAMARHRVRLGRDPIKVRARQICAELGVPVPPALQENSQGCALASCHITECR